MLPEDDSMDEVEKAYKIMEEEGDVSRTLERPKQVKPRKKTEKPKHKEQMLQTLDVEQSKAPKNTTKQKTEEPQELLEQTVDQPKVSAEEVQQSIGKQTETTSSIPEEPIEPPAFDTGTTLRDGFGRIYKPYLIETDKKHWSKGECCDPIVNGRKHTSFSIAIQYISLRTDWWYFNGEISAESCQCNGADDGILSVHAKMVYCCRVLSVLVSWRHPFILCYVQQAEIVPCYIEIQQDSPTKKLKVLSVTQGLTLYTSTAITVHSLIDHCLHSFDLQSGNWEIFAMNKKLDRFMYVGEVKKAFKSKPLHLYLIRKS